MKTAGRILFFVVIATVSGLALLLLLPGLKEGISQEELPALLAGILVFLALAVLWWRACGRALRPAVIGWLVLAVPILAYGAQAATLVIANIEGLRLAGAVRIENFRDAPIEWAGFDGPVGVTIHFDLVHPVGVAALILPPEIRMGPVLEIPRTKLAATHTNGSGYFKDTYLDAEVGDATLLKTVLFQRLYVNETAEQDFERWGSTYRFEPGERTRLTYHLHPGSVDFLTGPGHVCLSSRTYGSRICQAGEDPKQGCTSRNWRPVIEPVYTQGSDVTGLWMAAGKNDMTADFGPVLTKTLRAVSRLQGDPESWTAMQKRLEPSGFRAAGYRLCPPGEHSHTAFRTCYCRDGGE